MLADKLFKKDALAKDVKFYPKKLGEEITIDVAYLSDPDFQALIQKKGDKIDDLGFKKGLEITHEAAFNVLKRWDFTYRHLNAFVPVSEKSLKEEGLKWDDIIPLTREMVVDVVFRYCSSLPNDITEIAKDAKYFNAIKQAKN